MILWIPCRASELTFELPDRDRQCFYQEIEAGTQCSLEYQVCKGLYFCTNPIVDTIHSFYNVGRFHTR